MNVMVWTIERFAAQARRIAGEAAQIWTLRAPALVVIRDAPEFLCIWLHPNDTGTAWCDDMGRSVLDAATIAQFNLTNTVVFVGACMGSESTPLLEALRAAGAQAIIAGPGVNFGGADFGLAGADMLALLIRQALERGLPLTAAWIIARGAVRAARLVQWPGANDALEYQLLQPNAPPQRQPAGFLGVILGLVLTLLALWFGWTAPTGLILFSPISPLPLPEEISVWDKTLQVNGVTTDTIQALDFAYSAIVTDTDLITVTDAVSPFPYDVWGMSETVTYTLYDAWSASLVLSTYTYTVGSVVTDTNCVTWTVATDSTDTAYFTRTWEIAPGAWTWDAITETLTISPTSATKTVYLGHVGACLEPIALGLESDYDYMDMTNEFTVWALGSSPLTYTWTFGDGNSTVTSVPTTTHVYTSSGMFYPSVEIEGCSGITDTVGTTIYVGDATPTPSPTASPTITPSPTPTPRYTPRPWPTISYPTATPCVGFGCTPLDPEATLPYYLYLPLVFSEYP